MHKRVGAVENAIAILNLLAISRTGLRLVDISDRLEMNNSTCLSILRTLMRHDAARIDPSTKRYVIGGYIARLNDLVAGNSQTEQVAAQLMSDLARSYDVTVTVWHRTDERTLTLTHVFESEGEMRIAMQLGLSRPIYFGSIGLMYAACVNPPEDELRRACESYNWPNPPPVETYLAAVAAARTNGWAVDCGYAVRGMCSITMPVREPDGAVHRLCSAGMFQVVYEDEERRAAIIERLRAIQTALERPDNSL